MSERTHWDGCWRERTHHECAVARCEELDEEQGYDHELAYLTV